jgi:ubiquinone/menaquinone biosynthesis C-methylase UbiE
VLDVCCGSGASALPAAEVVGPMGFVTGVDLQNRCFNSREPRHAIVVCKT